MSYHSTLALALAVIAAAAGARARPVISEVLASSGGDGPDWVELLGQHSTTDLSGWCLSDASTTDCPWRFADGTAIEPGELLVIELGSATTGFALSRKGDAIMLSDRNDVNVASVTFGAQQPGVSYGLGGGETPSWRYFCSPSPGEPNGDDGLAARPDISRPFALNVSPPRGVYDDTAEGNIGVPTHLSIRAVRCGMEPSDGNEAASLQVRYTLDGSNPTATLAGDEFTAPIPLARTTIVRAVAVAADGQPVSAVVTHTIIFASTVLAQPNNPPGWPREWGGPGTTMHATPGDYAVDPRAGLTGEALLTVPVASLVMDSIDGWFGARGLYNNRESTAPFQASFEFIPPPDQDIQRPGLHSGCGVSSQGGSSVTSSPRGWKDEKASLRLRFKSVRWHHHFYRECCARSFRL